MMKITPSTNQILFLKYVLDFNSSKLSEKYLERHEKEYSPRDCFFKPSVLFPIELLTQVQEALLVKDIR